MLCSAMRKIQLKGGYQPVGSKFNPKGMEYFTKGPENSHHWAVISVGFICYLSNYDDEQM
jgi:hypothetical protein